VSGAVDLDSKIYTSTSIGIDHVSFPARGKVERIRKVIFLNHQTRYEI
jgi:hypothetical protein